VEKRKNWSDWLGTGRKATNHRSNIGGKLA
jgi:hypothetical protein